MKNGVMESDAMGDSQEPGAVDNRLTLNPSDFPQISKWKDGQTYSLDDLGDVTLTQISPGEFEVFATFEEEEPESEDVETPKKKDSYKNPAVASMAEEEE